MKFIVELSTKQFYGVFDSAEEAQMWAQEFEMVGAWAIRPVWETKKPTTQEKSERI